jgi:hypothetical protein
MLTFHQVSHAVSNVLAKGGFVNEPLVADGIARVAIAVRKQFDALHAVNSNVSTIFLNKLSFRRIYWGSITVVKQKSLPDDVMAAINLALLELYHIEVVEMFGLAAIAFLDIEVLRQRGYFISNRKLQSHDLSSGPDFLPATMPDDEESL